jgi:hypothetical protein
MIENERDAIQIRYARDRWRREWGGALDGPVQCCENLSVCHVFPQFLKRCDLSPVNKAGVFVL